MRSDDAPLIATLDSPDSSGRVGGVLRYRFFPFLGQEGGKRNGRKGFFITLLVWWVAAGPRLAAYLRLPYDGAEASPERHDGPRRAPPSARCLVRGSGWVPVGFADFKSVGPGPSVGAVGSTPSRSRHLYTGVHGPWGLSPAARSLAGPSAGLPPFCRHSAQAVLLIKRAKPVAA